MAENGIKTIVITDFGPLHFVELYDLGRINLIIGDSGAGKTFLLKILYSNIRVAETNVDLNETLFDMFRVSALSNLISYESRHLRVLIGYDNSYLGYEIRAESKPKTKLGKATNRDGHSIFIPSREIVSIHDAVRHGQRPDKRHEFDISNSDLLDAMWREPTKESMRLVPNKTRNALQSILNGGLYFDKAECIWLFRDYNGFCIPLNLMSEGLIKIAMFERIMLNGTLDEKSIVFMDLIEAGVFPDVLIKFLNVIVELAESVGVQFFITTHSLFALKKLRLAAYKKNGMISCISINKGSVRHEDLCYGGFDDCLTKTSISLYEAEMELL